MVQAIPTSGGDLLESGMTWLGENIAPYVEGLVNDFHDVIFGVPAPGTAGDISSWVNPANGWWPQIFEFYVFFSSIMYVVLFIGLFISFGMSNEVRKRQYQRGIVKAFVMVLFGFYICAACLHGASIISQAFTPTGAEFMQTPGDVAKLGLGVPIGIALLIYNAGAVFFGIMSIFLYYLVIHVLVASMPIFITLREMPQRHLQAIGDFGIAAFVVLLFIRVFQTIVLRLTFQVPWEAFGPELISGVFGIGVGLALAFVVIPVAGFYKLIPNAMMMISTGVVASKMTQMTQKAGKEGAKRGYNRVSNRTHEEKDTKGNNNPVAPYGSKNNGSTHNKD